VFSVHPPSISHRVLLVVVGSAEVMIIHKQIKPNLANKKILKESFNILMYTVLLDWIQQQTAK
jgi:hypothetical protein